MRMRRIQPSYCWEFDHGIWRVDVGLFCAVGWHCIFSPTSSYQSFALAIQSECSLSALYLRYIGGRSSGFLNDADQLRFIEEFRRDFP